ncbi:MAG: hypothetical protein HYT77_01470 [Deltaproteobacteria bacterium]|nr:hypothetical protein [Deltaproteobacteria bacterium]
MTITSLMSIDSLQQLARLCEEAGEYASWLGDEIEEANWGDDWNRPRPRPLRGGWVHFTKLDQEFTEPAVAVLHEAKMHRIVETLRSFSGGEGASGRLHRTFAGFGHLVPWADEGDLLARSFTHPVGGAAYQLGQRLKLRAYELQQLRLQIVAEIESLARLGKGGTAAPMAALVGVLVLTGIFSQIRHTE